MSFTKNFFTSSIFIVCLFLTLVCFVACGEDEKSVIEKSTSATSVSPTISIKTSKPTLTPTQTNKPTKDPTPKATTTPTPVPTPTPIKAGDILTIGQYEQDDTEGNGIEDLQWLVLERKDNKALVVTKYIIECIPFDENGYTNRWEDCSLRTWINNNFYNTTFSDEEKTKISQTIISTEENPNGESITGKEETDKIFILSISEIDKYFKSAAEKVCLATVHADKSHSISIDGGPYTYVPSECAWWLRIPSGPNCTSGLVGDDGEIYCDGYPGYNGGYIPPEAPGIGVRPAMWITVE